MKQTIGDIIGELIVNLKTYVSSKIDLYIISAFEKVAKLHASILSAIILVLISFFCLFFITVALAIWIGTELNNFTAGFLIIGGCYFLLGILFLVFRKSLIDKRIFKSLIKALFPEDWKN